MKIENVNIPNVEDLSEQPDFLPLLEYYVKINDVSKFNIKCRYTSDGTLINARARKYLLPEDMLKTAKYYGKIKRVTRFDTSIMFTYYDGSILEYSIKALSCK